MNRAAGLAMAVAAALLCSIPTFAEVLAQDLKTLRVPGKVAAVLWTKREDRCTLQVVLPIPGTGGRAISTAQIAANNAQPPKIELWLLGADGTVISPHYRWESPNPAGKGLSIRQTGHEINFRLPLAAGKQAVAAVLMVDGVYRVEQITPFSN